MSQSLLAARHVLPFVLLSAFSCVSREPERAATPRASVSASATTSASSSTSSTSTVASAAAPGAGDAGVDAAPAEAPWPPPPWSIVARGKDADMSYVYALGDVALIVVVREAGLSFATVEKDEITLRPELSKGLPKFGGIDLGAEKDVKFPKSNPKLNPRLGDDEKPVVESFSGLRDVVAVVGAWPGPIWLVADRWGGERWAWVVSDAYRWSAGAWSRVGGTKAVGLHYAHASPWVDGSLLVLQQNEFCEPGPGQPKLVALGTSRAAPTLPKGTSACAGDVRAKDMRAFSTGEVLVLGSGGAPDYGFVIERWNAGATSPSTQRLLGVESGLGLVLRADTADRLELSDVAASPYLGKPAEGAKWKRQTLTLTYTNGSYALADARRAASDYSPDMDVLNELHKITPKSAHFESHRAAIIGGARYVLGTLGKGPDAEHIVLRDRAVTAPLGL
jgi:hypothetical protein